MYETSDRRVERKVYCFLQSFSVLSALAFSWKVEDWLHMENLGLP